MTLPPLYKYLDINGARLTLRNGNFRHAKPSEFNDLEDLTIRSIFPESDDAALQEIKDNFTDILLRNLDRPPTCTDHRMRKQIELIQRAFRSNPDTAKSIEEKMKNETISEMYDLDGLMKRSEGYIQSINNFMQNFRVLCVSQEITSMRMWSRYAQDSQGIALRILPNKDKDSKFLQFRKVVYSATRPPLYKNVLDFLESGLFSDQAKRARAIMDDIIYSKTLEWEYEDEYRLVIPTLDGEDWRLMPYHSEEICELYFGHKTTDDTKAELISLARKRNPRIKIFHSCVDPYGRLLFL